MLPFVPRSDKGMGPGVSWSLLTRDKLTVSPKAALSYLSTPWWSREGTAIGHL